MFFVRRRKFRISSVVALGAALTLIAAEVFAGNIGTLHVTDSVSIPN